MIRKETTWRSQTCMHCKKRPPAKTVMVLIHSERGIGHGTDRYLCLPCARMVRSALGKAEASG